MQSRNAYILGSFVIPEGATTGARIEFDAELGRIRVYNSANQLEAEIVPGGVITAYDTATAPPAYVQLQGSNLWVVSGDETHYFRANATATGASMQVADDEQSNITASLSSAGVPFLRVEHRVGGGSVNQLQFDVDQSVGNLQYTNDTGVVVVQRFLETVGIMWARLVAGTATRTMFWDQVDGFLKSGTFNVTSGVRTTEAWTAIPGLNGYAGGSYRKYPDGDVMLDGNVAGGAAASPVNVATLPVGYRPRANVERTVSRFGVGPGVTNKITINAATGVIAQETPDATYNSWLSGIRFSTLA